MHEFENQYSSQTLAEGIAEYHHANSGLALSRSMSEEAQEFFRCHDAVHVVFGCGNSLNDEAIVKISSIFGTSGGFRALLGYRLHESLEIYRKLRALDVLISIVQGIYLVPRTIFRCLQQKRRWPWHDFRDYLSLSLFEIRKEFGIRVPRIRLVKGSTHSNKEF